MPQYQITCASCGRSFEVDKNYGTAYCPHCHVINIVANAVELPTEGSPQAPEPVQAPTPIPAPPATEALYPTGDYTAQPMAVAPEPQPHLPATDEPYPTASYTPQPLQPISEPVPAPPATETPYTTADYTEQPPQPASSVYYYPDMATAHPHHTAEDTEPSAPLPSEYNPAAQCTTPQEAVHHYMEWYKAEGYATNPFGVITGFEDTDSALDIDGAIRLRFPRFTYTIESIQYAYDNNQMVEVAVRYRDLSNALDILDEVVEDKSNAMTQQELDELLDTNDETAEEEVNVSLFARSDAQGHWTVVPQDTRQKLLLEMALTAGVQGSLEDQPAPTFIREPEPEDQAKVKVWSNRLTFGVVLLILYILKRLIFG